MKLGFGGGEYGPIHWWGVACACGDRHWNPFWVWRINRTWKNFAGNLKREVEIQKGRAGQGGWFSS